MVLFRGVVYIEGGVQIRWGDEAMVEAEERLDDRDLRPFVLDNDALQLCACAKTKKEEVHIYVVHVVSTTEPIEVIEWTQNAGEGGREEEPDVVVAGVECRDGGKGDARVEKEDIGKEDEATVKQVGVADLGDARVEDDGILEGVDVSEKGDASHRDVENELDESEEERYRDDDDCFGTKNKRFNPLKYSSF